MTITAVDLFAGAGGTSTGAHLAGVKVLAMVNHWPVAVATHAANYPAAAHHCEDAAILNPLHLPDSDLLLASPSCTGHSRARGKDLPHHDAARATAWCVTRVAEAKQPRAIIVENVPEMLQWVLYRPWRATLTALGYRVSEQILDAADTGVPQNRRRLFVVATRTRKPVIVGAANHPHVAARTALDLDGGSWSPVERPGRAAATLTRVRNGRAQFGDEPFLTAYYGSNETGRSIDRPCGTLTTRARYAIVRGDRMRMLTVDEMRRLQSFPEGYVLTGTVAEQTMQIGNSVPPLLAKHVIASVVRQVW